MVVHVLKNEEMACEAAAMLFAAQILRKPDSVLGFATGSTPVPVYRLLSRWHAQGLLDFSGCVSFNLDEYAGLPADHPQSYHTFMREHLFKHVNLKASHLPDGAAEDLLRECRRYDAAIEAAGGIDLQLLGIGHNGHIGFNEPDTVFPRHTHVVDLSPETIEANKRFFESADQVPRQAVSLGIGGIMAARSIVLLAFGAAKAPVIRRLIREEAAPGLPAGILHFHPQTTVFLDRQAAAGL